MAKEDSAPGLLSKMVKFVRNPATSWSELDTRETDRDEAVSKMHLKVMIERKRRNDFVRKREFDMLREIRKRDAISGQDQTVRPSFFQSSIPSKPDDRAKTLKKIDEIEAQMSMQWWKTKQSNGITIQSGLPSADSSLNFPSISNAAIAIPTPALPPSGKALLTISNQYGATHPIDLQALEISKNSPVTPVSVAGPVMSSIPLYQPPASRSPLASNTSTSQPEVSADVRKLNRQRFLGNHSEAGVSDFTTTNMMAMDVLEIAHDAELEEASIRYANGDNAGAEAGLLEMLVAGSVRAGQSETWMVLFDLYRATNQQDKFENTAIRFVQKFDRSAPQWFSLPDAVKKMVAPSRTAPSQRPTADWICPSTVGIQTIAALNVALTRAPMPWRLDWSNLKTVEPTAVKALCKVFADWSSKPVQLRFMGNEQLQQVLQKNTPSSDRDTLQDWWQLRMEALRVTHRPDEFELTALDFCVTYEVSPPAWSKARCDYKSIDPDGLSMANQTIIGDVFRDSSPSSLNLMDDDSEMGGVSSQMGRLTSVELAGQIEGDTAAMLDVLQAKLLGAENIVISCAKLIRVDFAAAGTLLNWVSARQDENRSIHFCDVNRLVAAFFNVIGITEHAKVTPRRD